MTLRELDAVRTAAILALAVGVLSLPAAAAGTTAVSLATTDQSVAVEETATVNIVVDDAAGGVGAYEATIEIDDPSVATITGVEVLGNPSDATVDVDVADDGSSAEIAAALMDTDDTGSVPIATVELEGEADAKSGVSLQVAALGDEGGESYDVVESRGGTIEVVSHDSGNPPEDTDRDGQVDQKDEDGSDGGSNDADEDDSVESAGETDVGSAESEPDATEGSLDQSEGNDETGDTSVSGETTTASGELSGIASDGGLPAYWVVGAIVGFLVLLVAYRYAK